MAEVRDQNAGVMAGATVTWSSSDTSVATVNASGLVTGVGVGAATITASAGSGQGTAEITVMDLERAALVAFYEATDGPNWVNSENWLTDAPLGDWYGVDTDGSGRIVRLNLAGRWDSAAREWIAHGLAGSIPAELSNLANLQVLYLSGNVLTGTIPAELGKLANLETMSLGNNGLSGPVPAELGNLVKLETLHLGSNDLAGSVPAELGSLANLQVLYLHGNELTGAIPVELGNLANLQVLYLSGNVLTGTIPAELGKLANLETLHLGYNGLSGPVPAELGNLVKLEYLRLVQNVLTEPLPGSLLDLTELGDFDFSRNEGLCAPGIASFADWLGAMEESEGPFCNESDTGVLESLFGATGGPSWTNAEGWLGGPALGGWHGVRADSIGRVTALNLSRNGLAGQLPRSLGELAHMNELRIAGNTGLSGRLPLSLASLSLRALHYAGTELCAPIGTSFRDWLNAIPSQEGTGAECVPLSDREVLEALYEATGGPDWTHNENWLTNAPLGEWYGVEVDGHGRVVELRFVANRLTGRIPPELGSLANLRSLYLYRAKLTGPLPAELGDLTNLKSIHFSETELTGTIPAKLGRLTNLERLSLGNNGLSGTIPSELGDLANLRVLYLHKNDLTGTIPPELGNLANLWAFRIEANRLTGPIPPELGNLASLRNLDLSRNDLTGTIPPELSGLAYLQRLTLSANGLTGTIPPELSGLADLSILYLGENELVGPVPPEFGGLMGLRSLGLQTNADLSGTLPASLTNLASLETFQTGGTGLCAPSEAGFLAWLEGVSYRRVALCESEPAAAYLVQAVQSREFPVPLVAGEEALLRVFVTASRDNDEPLPRVRASFHLNGALAHVADIPGGSGPIPTEVDEGSLATSANAVVPAEVVQPGLEMVVEVDPDGTLDAGLGVARRVPETGRATVDVQAMPLLDLTLVPFLWMEDPDLTVLESVRGMAADPEGHELLEFTRTLLPVGALDVKANEPVLSSSNDAYDLIAQTAAIRVMEGGTGRYMGMMSGSVTGAGGLSARPVSFARPNAGTIVHELGHNFNLGHAPCGGAGGLDPAFPYPDGSIGTWGYDYRDSGRLVHPSTPDLMSYCDPWWISDYYFSKALHFRLAEEGPPPAAAVASAGLLLLWGGIDAEGDPFLYPAFVVDAPPALPNSAGEHRIAGRTASGDELFALSFAMPDVADGDGNSSFALGLPVQPSWAGNLASIILSGPGGSVTLDSDTDIPMAVLRDPSTGQVRGVLRDLPQAGAAAALAPQASFDRVDVLFSRGIPDAAAWSR